MPKIITFLLQWWLLKYVAVRIAVHENILSSLSLRPKADESVSFQLFMSTSQ